MKLKSILAGALGLVLMASCSDANEPVPDGPGTAGSENFLLVKITNSLDSRADGDFEYGTEAEASINKLRFYFFKDGVAANVAGNGDQNFADVAVSIGTPTAPAEGESYGNIENTKTVEVPLFCSDKKNFDKTSVNQIVVIANPEQAKLPTDKSVALATLKGAVENYSIASVAAGNFVMTNSVYASDNSEVCEVAVTENNFIEKKNGQAVSNENATPVVVYIERVVAKVRVDFAWNNMSTEANITLNGQSGLTAVKLTEKVEGSDPKPIKVNDKDVYAIFTGWNVIGVTNQSYLFKHITPGWSFNPTWTWNEPSKFRSHWAINPDNTGISDATTWGDLKTVYGNDGAVYIQENAADHSNATSGEKTSQNTIAVFGAVLATLGENNVPTPLTLVKFGNEYLLEADAINKMYDNLTEKPYIAVQNAQHQYTNDIIQFLAFKEVSEGADDAQVIKVYLQLTEEAYNNNSLNFYKVIEGKTDENVNSADNIYSHDEINAKLKDLGAVNVAKNGMTYYTYPIKHLGKESDGKNYGQYGIVRNHLYDIQLKQVYGPGNFVFNPTTKDVSVVQHSFFINAQINVLSWRVVLNEAILDWSSARN